MGEAAALFDPEDAEDIAAVVLAVLESPARFAEAGINILEAKCSTRHPMVKNRFVVEVGDTGQLKQCIGRLRQVDSVFDAYRITPGV